MTQIQFPLKVHGHFEILNAIEEMSDYISSADVGDNFAEISRRVGEVDVEDSLDIHIEVVNKQLHAYVLPSGNLKFLLDKYEELVLSKCN